MTDTISRLREESGPRKPWKLEFEAAASANLLDESQSKVLRSFSRSGKLHVLDERDEKCRRHTLRALADSYGRAHQKSACVTLRRLGADELGRSGTFSVVSTAATAIRHWKDTRWRPFRNSPLPDPRIVADPISDFLASAAGRLTRRQVRYRAALREKQALGDASLVVLENVHEFSARRLEQLLREVSRRDVNIVLSGDFSARPWLAAVASQGLDQASELENVEALDRSAFELSERERDAAGRRLEEAREAERLRREEALRATLERGGQS